VSGEGLGQADAGAFGLTDVDVVQEPVDGRGGEGLGISSSNAEGQVGADRDGAFLVGGVDEAVQAFGGVVGHRSRPMSSTYADIRIGRPHELARPRAKLTERAAWWAISTIRDDTSLAPMSMTVLGGRSASWVVDRLLRHGFRGYGTGHGAAGRRVGLSARQAHLAVNASVTWCQLMLDTLNDQQAPWRPESP